MYNLEVDVTSLVGIKKDHAGLGIRPMNAIADSFILMIFGKANRMVVR